MIRVSANSATASDNEMPALRKNQITLSPRRDAEAASKMLDKILGTVRSGAVRPYAAPGRRRSVACQAAGVWRTRLDSSATIPLRRTRACWCAIRRQFIALVILKPKFFIKYSSNTSTVMSAAYEERFEPRSGPLRRVVRESVEQFLLAGGLQGG